MISFKRLIAAVFMLVAAAAAHRQWNNMFQISARPWLYELSLKYHHPNMRLGDVPEAELIYLVENNVNAIYLLGVWDLGENALNMDRKQDFTNVLPDCKPEDIIGSPFAITEYRVNPDVGSAADVRAFRDRLHRYGAKLFLDFVPNHTAADSPMVRAHPEYYIRKPAGWAPNKERFMGNGEGIAYGRDLYSGAWYDTAQFNLWSADLRRARVADMRAAADLSDGLRVDMAMLALDDIFPQVWGNELRDLGYTQPTRTFWEEVISEVRKTHPNHVFLAELYWGKGPDLLAQGFDFVYDKDLLDNLYTGDAGRVLGYLRAVGSGYLAKTAHFLSNHDEAPFESKTGNNLDMARAATAIVHTTPGIHFSWMGDWEGKQNKLEIHLRRRHNPDEVQHWLYDYVTKELLPAVRHNIFQWGSAEFAEPSDGERNSIVSFLWALDRDPTGAPIEVRRALTVVNYTPEEAGTRFRIPDARAFARADGTIVIKDLISGEEFVRDAAEVAKDGLWVVLRPWQAQVLTYA